MVGLKSGEILVGGEAGGSEGGVGGSVLTI